MSIWKKADVLDLYVILLYFGLILIYVIGDFKFAINGNTTINANIFYWPFLGSVCNLIKLMFSKKATKIEKIFTDDLTLTKRQINGEDLVNFCGLFRKHELYQHLSLTWIWVKRPWGRFCYRYYFYCGSSSRMECLEFEVKSLIETWISFYDPNCDNDKKFLHWFWVLQGCLADFPWDKFQLAKKYCLLLKLRIGRLFYDRNPHFTKGPFKYYVIKEVGGWCHKMAIFYDLQYCKSSKRWVGLKK